jgi:hypothetical protein
MVMKVVMNTYNGDESSDENLKLVKKIDELFIIVIAVQIDKTVFGRWDKCYICRMHKINRCL